MDKKLTVLILAGIIALLGVFYFVGQKDSVVTKIREIKKNPPVVKSIDENVLANLPVKIYPGGIEEVIKEQLTMEQIVALMRKSYSGRINTYKGRMALVEDLIRLFQAKGGDWVSDLYTALKLAFPDRADEIFELTENLHKYNEFLAEFYQGHTGFSDEENWQNLWDNRVAIFGEEMAKNIWASDLWTHKIQESLKEIEEGKKGSSLDQKLDAFDKSLETTLQDKTEWYKKNQTINLVNQFLTLESVQKELTTANENSRSEALRKVRKKMGLADDALDRLANLDKVRDTRWSDGERYMQERSLLEKQFSGSELESRLDEIRQKLLGNEWEFVKNEEATGYFRYKDKRVYGVN